MTDPVRAAYDTMAERYAALFLHELDRDSQTLEALAAFAEAAAGQTGPVMDLGCGPGGAVDHLRQRGLSVFGVDASPGQIAQARMAFPERHFAVGDLTALGVPDASLGGIVAKYSIIHLPPADLPAVFGEWHRALAPGAPVLVSFFGSRSGDNHGRPFDHRVITAYELFPDTVADLLRGAGFRTVRVEASPIPEGGRPFDHTTVLAGKPSD
ncbi:MAG: class I SAM-dependent methyltransferase [Actinomycetota bacterium]